MRMQRLLCEDTRGGSVALLCLLEATGEAVVSFWNRMTSGLGPETAMQSCPSKAALAAIASAA